MVFIAITTPALGGSLFKMIQESNLWRLMVKGPVEIINEQNDYEVFPV